MIPFAQECLYLEITFYQQCKNALSSTFLQYKLFFPVTLFLVIKKDFLSTVRILL